MVRFKRWPISRISRYIICFHDFTFEQASEYMNFWILSKRGETERERNSSGGAKKRWCFLQDIKKMRKQYCLKTDSARAEVSDFHMLTFAPKINIFQQSNCLCVWWLLSFSLLQSAIHEVWIRRNASTMRTDVSYGHTDCFQTFPFPKRHWKVCWLEWNKQGRHFMNAAKRLCVLVNLAWLNSTTCSTIPHAMMKILLKCTISTPRWTSLYWHAMVGRILACCTIYYPNDRKKIRFTPAPEASVNFHRLIALTGYRRAESSQGLVVEVAKRKIWKKSKINVWASLHFLTLTIPQNLILQIR